MTYDFDNLFHDEVVASAFGQGNLSSVSGTRLWHYTLNVEESILPVKMLLEAARTVPGGGAGGPRPQ